MLRATLGSWRVSEVCESVVVVCVVGGGKSMFMYMYTIVHSCIRLLVCVYKANQKVWGGGGGGNSHYII